MSKYFKYGPKEERRTRPMWGERGWGEEGLHFHLPTNMSYFGDFILIFMSVEECIISYHMVLHLYFILEGCKCHMHMQITFIKIHYEK